MSLTLFWPNNYYVQNDSRCFRAVKRCLYENFEKFGFGTCILSVSDHCKNMPAALHQWAYGKAGIRKRKR